MTLQVLVSAPTMEKLILQCNMICIKGGISYQFTPVVFDGKKFYTTYYVNTENAELIRKISANERRLSTRK